MWGWSDDAWRALASGHTAISRVDVWHSGSRVYTLVATSGSVNLDADRPVRANLSCTLVDPTGDLSRGDVGDLLNPYECEIAVYRGVRITTSRTSIGSLLTPNQGFGVQPFGSSGFGGVDGAPTVVTSATSWRDEFAPLGVFRLTGREVSDTPDGLSIRITGLDRAMVFQGPMSSPLAVNAGTPVETVIRRLLNTRQPGLSLSAMSTGEKLGPLVFAPDIDVWAEAQKLAQSVGARLFHDRQGQATLALAGPVNDRPVAVYSQGGGLLLNLDRAEDSDTINNVVVAESQDGSIRVVVEDLDPTSPTYSRGRYGRRVLVMKNPYFASVKQAQQAAATRLAYELGRSETVNFTAVPNPGLDVDEVVTVHRPRAGLTYQGVVTSSITVPLGATEAMRVDCRQSRLAQNGQILPELVGAA